MNNSLDIYKKIIKNNHCFSSRVSPLNNEYVLFVKQGDMLLRLYMDKKYISFRANFYNLKFNSSWMTGSNWSIEVNVDNIIYRIYKDSKGISINTRDKGVFYDYKFIVKNIVLENKKASRTLGINLSDNIIIKLKDNYRQRFKDLFELTDKTSVLEDILNSSFNSLLEGIGSETDISNIFYEDWIDNVRNEMENAIFYYEFLKRCDKFFIKDNFANNISSDSYILTEEDIEFIIEKCHNEFKSNSGDFISNESVVDETYLKEWVLKELRNYANIKIHNKLKSIYCSELIVDIKNLNCLNNSYLSVVRNIKENKISKIIRVVEFKKLYDSFFSDLNFINEEDLLNKINAFVDKFLDFENKYERIIKVFGNNKLFVDISDENFFLQYEQGLIDLDEKNKIYYNEVYKPVMAELNEFIFKKKVFKGMNPQKPTFSRLNLYIEYLSLFFNKLIEYGIFEKNGEQYTLSNYENFSKFPEEMLTFERYWSSKGKPLDKFVF